MAELFMVFDDPIMDNGNFTVREMRMRITFTRFSMRCPTRVRDACIAGNGGLRHRISQHVNFSLNPQAL
jgi:hypothetical protein